MTELSAFLHLYLFQIENIANNNLRDLCNINFQSEEANTDKELKLLFKHLILNNNRIVEPFYIDVKSESTNYIAHFKIDDLLKYHITNVDLPAELTDEQKVLIKSQKTSVYTNPDLLLEISHNSIIEYISIELKSTKGDKIPGSSIQQISPFEWVIFVQYNENSVTKVITGQYINSITSRLPFPDRSPRPEMRFAILDRWNSKNRLRNNDTLTYINLEDNSNKVSILTSWHDHLVKEWIDTVKNKIPKKKEKWFNHTIRLYSLKLLDHYNSLSDQDKQMLLENLTELTSRQKSQNT